MVADAPDVPSPRWRRVFGRRFFGGVAYTGPLGVIAAERNAWLEADAISGAAGARVRRPAVLHASRRAAADQCGNHSLDSMCLAVAAFAAWTGYRAVGRSTARRGSLPRPLAAALAPGALEIAPRKWRELALLPLAWRAPKFRGQGGRFHLPRGIAESLCSDRCWRWPKTLGGGVWARGIRAPLTIADQCGQRFAPIQA